MAEHCRAPCPDRVQARATGGGPAAGFTDTRTAAARLGAEKGPGADRARQPAGIIPGTQQSAAVAQHVVLYEEDPADPHGKRFVGSAIWRTEMVTRGPGQPPELAVRADIEVPERKMAMTLSLRRNTDKALPASHTVEIMFKLPADFPSGGISNVPGMLMKQAEQTRGVPLAGLAVKVTPGFFLIGLSNLEADKERNLQLLKEPAGSTSRWSTTTIAARSSPWKRARRRERVRRCVQGVEAVR